jgi:hypothetical protein
MKAENPLLWFNTYDLLAHDSEPALAARVVAQGREGRVEKLESLVLKIYFKLLNLPSLRRHSSFVLQCEKMANSLNKFVRGKF